MAWAVEHAKSCFEQVILNPYGRTMSTQELLEHTDGIDGIIAGLETYDAQVIAKLPQSLKVISRFGIGYDAIDVTCARAAGIEVTNTPAANTVAIAEHTIGMMLAMVRNIVTMNQQSKAGQWKRLPAGEIEGKTLGIIGLGNIGRKVALKAIALGMQVITYEPYLNEDFAKTHGIVAVTLDALLAQSDVVTIHTMVTPETTHIANEVFFKKMKPEAYFLNIARGALVDEDALYAALKQGDIKMAAIDVFELEPPGENKLLTLENLIVSPHVGGMSQESDRRMSLMCIENCCSVLNGETCSNCVK